MFKLDDEEKSAKEKVLQEIMSMMDGHNGDKIKGLKGSPKAIEVAAVKAEPVSDNGVDADMVKGEPADGTEEHEALETPHEELSEHALGGSETDEEMSEEDKNMVSELYHRFCR